MMRLSSMFADPVAWILFKWSLMSAAVFWVLVYRFSEAAAKFPEFVYVNF